MPDGHSLWSVLPTYPEPNHALPLPAARARVQQIVDAFVADLVKPKAGGLT